MTIYVGTIHELQGRGYEIMVDVETRNQILGHFYDGKLVAFGSMPFEDEPSIRGFEGDITWVAPLSQAS